MTSMASMGNYGTSPQNCFRDLKKVLGLPEAAPGFTFADIPTIHGPATPHPFIMPHEFFAKQFAKNKGMWASAISGPADAAQEFWRSMKKTEFLKAHPDLPREKWGRTIPLRMHGDGAAFSHQDSIYTFCWNSLLGAGQTIAKRFVISFIKKSEMVEGTMDAMTRIMAWSFNAMLSGRYPIEDWVGRPLAGGGGDLADGWRGALSQC